MIKAIIIDDEIRSIDNLSTLISLYLNNVEVIATSSNIEEAYTLINQIRPDIVFLDIDMPPYTGFDLLKKFETIFFEIIFVTAFDFYAIKAIKYSALYYILKPIDKDELILAVEKAKKTIGLKNSDQTNIINQLKLKNKVFENIAIRNLDSINLVKVKDILYIQSSNVYSIFFMNDGSKYTCSQKSIKDYEDLFSNRGFFRTHQSFLINMEYVKSIENKSSEVILINGMKVPISRRRKTDMMSILGI